MIQEKLSNKHKVYLTRSIDRPVTLAERAAIADKVHADLFISLHFNSSKKRKYHGFETYYLDNHADVAVKKVESIENNEWKESERIVNQILVDLVIEKTVPQSKKLTNYIHSRISQKIGRKHRMKDRGIKPGLFYVLALSKRPNALLEVGFLSNPKEAKKISSKKFLNDYANGVVKGIEDYANSNHTLASVPLF
jgi:N-acetylmuramoyl-L-alanine amidase